MPAESSSIPAPATWALVAGAVADPRPLACRQDELAETGCVDSPSFLFCSHEATSSGEMYVCRFSLVSGVSAKDQSSAGAGVLTARIDRKRSHGPAGIRRRQALHELDVGEHGLRVAVQWVVCFAILARQSQA